MATSPVNFAPEPVPLYICISIVCLKKRSNVNGVVFKTYRIGTCGSTESKKKKKPKKKSKIRQRNWGGDWGIS